MTIFYAPDVSGQSHVLDAEESRHCVRVLRLREGDAVALVDGLGGMFEARVRHADPRGCVLDIERVHRLWGHRPWRLTLAVAPTKSAERLEWMVEKCTEVGVDAFVPLISARSERRTLKTDRADRIIVSAMKQSLKAFKPALEPPTPFDALVSRPFEGAKLIAHCIEEGIAQDNGTVVACHPEEPEGRRGDLIANASRCYIGDCVSRGQDVLLLIGPEGDFTPDEVALALANGFQPVSLGASRLRTETAALAAAIEVSLMNR